MATQVLVRSIDRTANSSSSSDFTVNLPQAVEGIYIISNILFPNTIYCFESGVNDKIYFYENSTSKTATIAPGVYTSSSVLSAIKTAMDTASSGHNSYTVSYSSTTRKLSFSASNAFYFEFSASTGDNCARQLGFADDTDTASGTSITAPNVIDLVGAHSLLMRIDQAYEALESTGDSNHATVWIPISASFGTYQQAVSLQHNIQKITLGRTKHLKIKIFNSKNQAISLNGGNFELLLTKTSELPRSLQFDDNDESLC